MVKIRKKVGENAGKVWNALNTHGLLSEFQLLEKTNISSIEIHAAIGWLAQENKIFKNGEFFSLNENKLIVNKKEEENNQTSENSNINNEDIEIINDSIQKMDDNIHNVNGESFSENIGVIDNPNLNMDNKFGVTNQENISEVPIVDNEAPDEKNANIVQDSVMIEETSTQNIIPPWKIKDLSTGTCDLCKNEIEFKYNLSGLVVADEFFACEDCCQTLPKNEIFDWTKSKMLKPGDVRPIALWITEEKNKGHGIIKK